MSLRRLSEKKRALAIRSRTLQAVRKFFSDRGFTEVETPVRIPAPALELHIDAEPSDDHYLRTSPEIYMKRMLAAGYEKIYQMGACFRRGERGRLHNPEYTMLEWYRADAGYIEVLADAKALIAFVMNEINRGTRLVYRGATIEVMPLWERLTVEDAYLMHAGWNPVKDFDADRFDLDFVEKVEPKFPADRPTILMDYPAGAAALARRKPGKPEVAERWELFIGGLELANAFSELTDPVEQRRRFEECARKRREMGKAVYPLDEEFLAALQEGLPRCAGVAMGIDRLAMLLADTESIEDVRAFC